MKKKQLGVVLLAALVLLLTACGGGRETSEIAVFAAASLQETLTEIGEQYRKERGNVELVFSFDSSGTLKTQIREGAECDLFLSAGQRQMDQLDASAGPDVNTEGLDFVLPDTRVDLLENQVVLCVPEGNPKGVDSFDGLAQLLEDRTVLLAMGNSDVPVGQYTQKILNWYGLDEEALAAAGCITYGSNVKEVTTQVSESSVDCGVIYRTDAFSAGLTVVDSAGAEMCGQVIYPAAVLAGSAHSDEAQAFLDYVRSSDGAGVLESVGFTPLE